MGILHFITLGRSPGAATAGLAYLKNEKIHHPEKGSLVEDIILFTSPEVHNGTEKVKECVWNEYMSMNSRKIWKDGNVVDIVSEFIKDEIGPIMDDKGTLYCCEVNPNDFDDCFKKLAHATLRFSPPGKTGKHIWVNITGGTNIMNAAILEVTFLSGLIAKIYYTFISDLKTYGKYLQPVTRDRTKFGFGKVPIVKTKFDESYYEVLRELNTLGREIKDEDLLSRLKNRCPNEFDKVGIDTFRREFINKMDGLYLKRKETKGNEV